MKAFALLRHLTALYVEDDPAQIAGMSELLQGFFHELVVAENGETGLQTFRSRPIHLVITDIRMPGMNGLELIAAIRQLDRQVPICIITGYTETTELLTATRLHLTAYLIKPLSWGQIKAALERCVETLLAEGRLFVQLGNGTLYCAVNGCLWPQAERLPLTAREQTLMTLLAAHRGQWLSTERLLAEVYDESETGSAAGLKNVIGRLRHKLGAGTIVNRYGLGYRLREPRSASSG